MLVWEKHFVVLILILVQCGLTLAGTFCQTEPSDSQQHKHMKRESINSRPLTSNEKQMNVFDLFKTHAFISKELLPIMESMNDRANWMDTGRYDVGGHLKELNNSYGKIDFKTEYIYEL